ncbi:MAG: hypothetical protein WC531_02570 [Candidatus Paceibacterota bacterium]
MKPSILVCQKCHRARMGNAPWGEVDVSRSEIFTLLWCYCPECRASEFRRIMDEFHARKAGQSLNLETITVWRKSTAYSHRATYASRWVVQFII